MPKIVMTHDLGLSVEDVKRLKSLGELTIFANRPKSGEEWLKRCAGADIICSGTPGLREKYQELSNVFISLPFVGVFYLDKEILRQKNIMVSNSPGGNKDAVAEWIVGMIISLLREMLLFINNNSLSGDKLPAETRGLPGKKLLILGKGNIGVRVAEICTALKMKVDFFEKDDSLAEKSHDQDVIVNCLSTNETTRNILDAKFFAALKNGAVFISVSSREIYDAQALFAALDNEILAGAAIDDGTMNVGNTGDAFYQGLLKHPKIIATPHIAYNTDVSASECNRIMIDNIEAYLNGRPQNLI